MSVLHITKYYPNHPALKRLVKYFWVIQSDGLVNIHHKLLPVDNIDIILNVSDPITYKTSEQPEFTPKPFHFNGVREKFQFIHQTGQLTVFGISFFPGGLFPFVKTPLSEYVNQTIELDTILAEFSTRLEEIIKPQGTISVNVNLIETELIQILNLDLISMDVLNMLAAFKLNNGLSIRQFCDWYGIAPRTLERCFNRYIGVSPKLYQRLDRFQTVIRQLIKNPTHDLTSIAYVHAYYDQSHFLKDFKLFTGNSPSQFLQDKRSVKEILN